MVQALGNHVIWEMNSQQTLAGVVPIAPVLTKSLPQMEGGLTAPLALDEAPGIMTQS
jgi:hypothetical protein